MGVHRVQDFVLGIEALGQNEELKKKGACVRAHAATPYHLQKCWFCGMDPGNHLGRDCPTRRPQQAKGCGKGGGRDDTTY